MEMNLNFFGEDTLINALWDIKDKPQTFEEKFNG